VRQPIAPILYDAQPPNAIVTLCVLFQNGGVSVDDRSPGHEEATPCEYGDDGAVTERVIRLHVDGQEFSVRARPGEPGVYDFTWDNGPYGFSSATSDQSPMNREALEASIKNFLSVYDPQD
jgi:hypothetical protein